MALADPSTPLPSTSRRCFAVLPAAGRSERMGTSKLLLPWPASDGNESTVIDTVLAAWLESEVNHVVAVVRADDEPLQERVSLKHACSGGRLTMIHPDGPIPDMKASVMVGLRWLSTELAPSSADRCFIAPADLPKLSSPLIDRLIQTDSPPDGTVVPHFGGRRGHPALLGWPLTDKVFHLNENQGVKAIVEAHAQVVVPFEANERIDDIDTPEEYAAALQSARKHI